MFQITTHDYFASTEDRRAWLHCSMNSDNHGKRYENEYMFVLSFDEQGEKLTKIVEMVDSQRVREAWADIPEVKFTRK
jgi:ketosteroid isomerase-like protein